MGKSIPPPGSKKIVNEGTDLQMSNNCFFVFVFVLFSAMPLCAQKTEDWNPKANRGPRSKRRLK